MSYALAAFDGTEPVAHVVAWLEWLRLEAIDDAHARLDLFRYRRRFPYIARLWQ